MVIDNERGRVDEIALQGSRVATDEIGIRANADAANVLRDCSTDEVRCAEFEKPSIKLAFKPGAIGEGYKVGEVGFVIVGVTALAHDAQTRLYAIGFNGPKQRGGFVYSTSLGVVSIVDECLEMPTVLDTGKCVPDREEKNSRKLFLTAGPGLLSPQGFPRASNEGMR